MVTVVGKMGRGNAFNVELIFTMSVPQLFTEAQCMPGADPARLSGGEGEKHIFSNLLYW